MAKAHGSRLGAAGAALAGASTMAWAAGGPSHKGGRHKRQSGACTDEGASGASSGKTSRH